MASLRMPDEKSSDVSAMDSFLREVAAVSEPEGSEYPHVAAERRRRALGSLRRRAAGGQWGGMGAVYRATDRSTGAPVAVK
jgi:hypothetical protein